MKRAKIRTLQGFPVHVKNVGNVDKNKKACKIMEKRMRLIQQKIHTKEDGYALLGVDNVDNYFPSSDSPISTTFPAPIVINRSPFIHFFNKNFSISSKEGK
jgi:hypothetical protein